MGHRVGARARADLDAIWAYIVRETGREDAADRLIEAITLRFHLLAEHPRIGGARDDDLGRGRRSFPVADYVIVYRIVGKNVQILGMAHSRRDLAALFGR